MKRAICLLMSFIMLLSLAACGSEKTAEVGENISVEDSASQERVIPNGNTESETEDTGAVCDVVSNVGISGGCICYFDSRREEMCGDTMIFRSGYDDLIALISTFDKSITNSAEEDFTLLNTGKMFWDLCEYTEVPFNDYDNMGKFVITPVDKEFITVGETETMRFQGTVPDADGVEHPAYGYAFNLNDISCMLAGIQLTENPTDAEMTSLMEEVDAMMATVKAKY